MSRILIFIAGAVSALVLLAVVGVGVFLFMPGIVSINGLGHLSPSPTPSITANNAPAGNKPVNQYLKQYSTNIDQQLAQGLKLTPDQLTTQLRSGKTLTQIATDQKVTGMQLNNLIASALQNSLQPAITSGVMTQKQVSNQVKHFQKNPDQLGHLLVEQGHDKKTPTPAP